MIIEFGRWQLRPSDNRNWQLWVWKSPDYRGKRLSLATSGQKANIWAPTGKFFQWPNIGYAVHYAASRDLMDREGTATPWEAAEELTRTCDALLSECRRSLANYTDPNAKSDAGN